MEELFERLRISVDTDIASIEAFRKDDIVVVNFQLKKAIQAGEEARLLAQLITTYITRIVKPRPQETLVLSGRGPIWLYALLYHYLHGQVSNVAVFDPKLQGAVLIGSHYGKGEPGDVISIPEEMQEKLLGQPPK